MVKFPEPPKAGQLRARAAPTLAVLPAGTLLFRVYFRSGGHPTTWSTFRTFGPTGARFDHHLADASGQPQVQARGILYATTHGPICLAEVFQRSRVIDRHRADPHLTAFVTRREMSLLDLRSTWTTKAGASTAINSGRRDRARRWSQAIYAAFETIDGLFHPSSMHGHAPALALYERATDALPQSPSLNRALADAALDGMLRNTAAELGYALV